MSSEADEIQAPRTGDGSEERSTLRQQSGAVVGGLRDAVLQLVRHVEALAELFELEMQEYVRRQKRYVVAMAVGAGLLGCAYLVLCIYAVLLLQPVLTLSWAVLSVVLFNVLVGFIALLVAGNSKPTGLAPDTVKEIKNDIECAKLYLNGKGKR